jgi:mannose-6-phosphate isomerase-like protein (cupin superfamily)
MKGMNVMASEFLFDLKDPEHSWKGFSVGKSPDGRIGSKVGSVIPAEGPRQMFWMLDSIMYAAPEGTDHDANRMAHSHSYGYETFFVDGGKFWLYIDGMKCLVTKGDILHLQAGQIHGMSFIEDTLYRGTYHDLMVDPDGMSVNNVLTRMPELKDDPELLKLMPSSKNGLDHIQRERILFKEVPVEQCSAVRNTKRPLFEYKFDGVTMKIITQRWENAGANELCCAEMEPGFTAEWVKYPKNRELLYLRSGQVKFKIYNEEFIADDECIINIPKYAPHSLEVLKKSELFDLGGLTHWYSFLHDYMSVKTYDPERFSKPETIEALKAKFSCQIKSIGRK